jgi:signal transduction histidine kinase
MLSAPLILIISIYALAKKYQGALYFVIGEGIYLLTIAYVSFAISGHNSATMQYALIPFAFLVEMILLSMALAHRIAEIKLDNDIKNSLMIEEEKFVSVGKSIGNIIHQWKEPISQLSSYLMHLESLYHLKKNEMLLSEFGSNIENMNNTLVYMKGTVNDLYDFYSNSDHDNRFNLRKKIDMACKLQRDNLILLHIDTIIDCSDEIFVSGAKHAISNVLMILFDNSIYQLTHTVTANPTITINVIESSDTVILHFSDNGGGIDPKVINKIFTTSCTTKGKNGCGFGLTLANKLVNERLNGAISVVNAEVGALFSITLHKAESTQK